MEDSAHLQRPGARIIPALRPQVYYVNYVYLCFAPKWHLIGALKFRDLRARGLGFKV